MPQKEFKKINRYSYSYVYDAIKRRVMKTPYPEEKDWLQLKYEDKESWINKYRKIPEF